MSRLQMLGKSAFSEWESPRLWPRQCAVPAAARLPAGIGAHTAGSVREGHSHPPGSRYHRATRASGSG